MVSNGVGYTLSNTTVKVVGGGGSGATGTPVIDPTTGAITAITFVSGGSGYGTTPGIRKFVAPLPTLPNAVPDQTTYTIAKGFPADSDYYEIALVEYTQKLSPDLPVTTLRGYVQLETANIKGAHYPLVYNNPAKTPIVDANSQQLYGVTAPTYLGPIIQAASGKPVRVKFYNLLPAGSDGNLFLPVDTTVMGAGMGPLGSNYSQNRAGIHLHGGATPWISDGTPDQWTTPAGTSTAYPHGVSVVNVPDMDGGNEPDGTMTFYYTNQQSARLMFYHDHTYGITRLNVYGGAAAGYIVRDAAEQAMINGGSIPAANGNPGVASVTAGTIPADELPVIIQDKTFVDATTIDQQDPTWRTQGFGSQPNTPVTGDLWFPHVYMPNQNPYDLMGVNAMGRWDYGPWFWPPYTGLQNGPVPNLRAGYTPEEGPVNPGTPNPSIVPEGFMDTMLVNGMTYPFVQVDPKAYRLRILNASNDRSLNLQLYFAKSNLPMWNPDGTLNDANAGEIPMVPAVPGTGLPKSWPTDGRDGGVPDPKAAGPDLIQIGTEGGFLPQAADLKNTPVGYDYNRKSITVLNVLNKTLFLGPAERADVIVDFSGVPAGSNLILYNDAPAPVPAFDPRYDYYTGDPDQTSTGGAPTTQPGYGPNTRTVMQFQVSSATAGTPVNLATLNQALGAAFAATQPMPIVPQAPYDAAYNANYPAGTGAYVRIQDTSMSFFNGPLTGLTLTNKGAGYTAAPGVSITPPGGAGTAATATATLGGSNVTSISVTNGGAGYTSAPTVGFQGASTTSAAATATITKVVNTITVTKGGSKYTSPPMVTISGGGGTGATAVATVTNGAVSFIQVVQRGTGYTSTPSVKFSGGGGSGATATAVLTGAVKSVTVTSGGLGYGSAPTVTFSNGGGTGAAATATIVPGFVASITLTNPGTAYTSVPTVSFNGGLITGGTSATAVALGVQMALQPKAIQELFDVDYGRMNATLGVELPNTTGINQTTIPYGFIDPPTEIIKATGDAGTQIGTLADGTQIWKITHNGVDTHAIHWHMFNVQLLNRVGWDGMVKPPDANELGWKETVRMNPLEDAIVALRPIIPTNLPFKLPNSVRRMDVTMPVGSTMNFTGVDPNNLPVTVVNAVVNFGWEYVWHCHLLGHEENDMMRPMIIAVAPEQPTNLTAVSTVTKKMTVSFKDQSLNETSFTVQRASSANGPWTTVKTFISAPDAASNTAGSTLSFTDTVTSKATYYYQVIANDQVGSSVPGYPSATASSLPVKVDPAVAK
jgi:FtsP/CotA-like multicopper oxidase with cupredoxin domain